MTERALTTMFAKHLKECPRASTDVFEFKMVKGKSLSFKSVQSHQVSGLMDALKGMWYKIQDSPFGGNNQRFTSKKPFDAVWIIAKNAYVAPIFYKERTYKKAFLIPIFDFINFTGTSIKMTELEERGYECIKL